MGKRSGANNRSREVRENGESKETGETKRREGEERRKTGMMMKVFRNKNDPK